MKPPHIQALEDAYFKAIAPKKNQPKNPVTKNILNKKIKNSPDLPIHMNGLINV